MKFSCRSGLSRFITTIGDRALTKQTEDELIYGAALAWRNSTRCIGRIFWESLRVRDLRHLTTAEDIFAAIVDHIQQATNGGNIRPTISIFAPDSPGVPGIRIWNPQLIRYAGYRQADGSIVGEDRPNRTHRMSTPRLARTRHSI